MWPICHRREEFFTKNLGQAVIDWLSKSEPPMPGIILIMSIKVAITYRINLYIDKKNLLIVVIAGYHAIPLNA